MNLSWISLQVSYLLFLLMLFNFFFSFLAFTKLMFIHIASDFLSTHIKCFLIFFRYFVHDNFAAFFSGPSASTLSCLEGI